jgi:hypothetical protein
MGASENKVGCVRESGGDPPANRDAIEISQGHLVSKLYLGLFE